MRLLTKDLNETWQKIRDFELDEDGVTIPFSKKLSKENNWSAQFTLRAIEEYKRFIFLTIISPNGASPSYIVDQVWHLHLTFTKSYWENFCGQTLNKSIHHHPSKGGEDEKKKHVNWYKETLQLYKEVFDEEPPPDIWMPAVDAGTKPIEKIDLTLPFSQAVLLKLLLLFLLPFIFNLLFFEQALPYLLSGSHFLQFYVLLCFVAIIAVHILNKDLSIRIVEAARSNLPSSYNIFEAISFISGKDRALQAAIIDLMKKDVIELKGKKFINKASDDYLIRYNNPLISKLLQEHQQVSYQRFTKMFKEEKIINPYLVMLQNYADEKVWYPKLIFLSILLTVVARTVQGFNNNKPVGFLIILTGVFSMIYWVVYNKTNKKSLIKNTFKEKFEQDDLRCMNLMPYDEILRSFALSGAAAIREFEEFQVLATMFATYSTVSNNSGDVSFSTGGSSCGSSCGGGCGGGCGGCGGD